MGTGVTVLQLFGVVLLVANIKVISTTTSTGRHGDSGIASDEHHSQQLDGDVGVYGATPGGIATAISAANRGSRVVLLVAKGQVGGMMSGGLGWDDTAFGASSDPRPVNVYGNSSYTIFASEVEAHYRGISQTAESLSHNGTRHEPHVAEEVFLKMLKAANVSLRMIDELDFVDIGPSGDIVTITVVDLNETPSPQCVPTKQLHHTENNTTTFSSSTNTTNKIKINTRCPRSSSSSNTTTTTFKFGVYVDASYEGDLLAAANASFRVGRESRSEFGELNAGVVFTNNQQKSFLRGSTGVASAQVPAMTWRLCFTTNTTNMYNVSSPPDNYNRSLYLGYVDDVTARRIDTVWNAWSSPRALPPMGNKFDINCNPRPLGFIWAGDEKEEYISANRTRRTILLKYFRDITLGLLYFQQNDLSVSAEERAANQRYGLCMDEFSSSDYFPPQLYIREARRLQARVMFSERDMVPADPDGRPPVRADACAVGSFPVDSFPCSNRMPSQSQKSADTALEGYISMEDTMVSPNTLPIGAMLSPTVSNIIVPVAMGATHVAFSSVRLEPTWMLLGDAAGKLATLAIESGKHVGDIPLLRFQQLVTRNQPLIKFEDLVSTVLHYEAMMVLGPHGVADDDTFNASATKILTRGVATRWLMGALVALNSTTANAATMPKFNTSLHWEDFNSDDDDFDSAIACAHFNIFPLPNINQSFFPHDDISASDWATWLTKAFPSFMTRQTTPSPQKPTPPPQIRTQTRTQTPHTPQHHEHVTDTSVFTDGSPGLLRSEAVIMLYKHVKSQMF